MAISANSEWTNSQIDIAAEITKHLMSWWIEHKDYTYGKIQETDSCTAMCGHFTQMAWARATKVGCAVINSCPQAALFGSDQGMPTLYTVCRYDDGNWMGENPWTARSVQDSTTQESTTQNSATQDSTTQDSTTQDSTTQYSTYEPSGEFSEDSEEFSEDFDDQEFEGLIDENNKIEVAHFGDKTICIKSSKVDAGATILAEEYNITQVYDSYQSVK